MAYYEELGPIVMGVIGRYMLRNQNLCKLLYYYPEDNNEQFTFDPYACPNIEDPSSKLFMKYIFPMPKLPDASLDKVCYITVTLNGGYEPEVNNGFRTVNLLIDIICHLDVWCIKNATTIRPYDIMHEIDKMLNNQLTDLPIVNKPYSRGFQPRNYSNYFSGVQMLYELGISSNVSCDPTPQNVNLGRLDNPESVTIDELLNALIEERANEKVNERLEKKVETPSESKQEYSCLPKNIGFKNGKKL